MSIQGQKDVSIIIRGRHSRDRMIVGFRITVKGTDSTHICKISAYHQ